MSGVKGQLARSPKELIEFARVGTAQSRHTLAVEMTDLFGEPKILTSERERDLAAEILERLIRAFEVEIRRDLAERLSSKPLVPRGLILMLAHDEIEVARPILLGSEAVTADDLIAVIHGRGIAHQRCIAQRDGIDEPVCNALVATDSVDVIKTLLHNSGARISEATMAYLVEEAHWVESYREPLIERRELEPPLARRLYSLVSAALRKHILERFDLDPSALDDALEDIVVERGGGGRVSRLATQIAGLRRVTPELLIKVMRGGDRPLFEQLLAQHAELSEDLLRRILYGNDGREVAILCRALDFEKSEFAVIFFLTSQGGPGREVQDPRDVAPLMDFFDHLEPAQARQTLDLWRRDPDYVAAVMDFDERDGDD